MAPKKREPQIDPSKLSYEGAVSALEELVRQIEEGTIGLQESVEAYRRGVALVKRCREILDAAEQDIQHIDEQEAAARESVKRSD